MLPERLQLERLPARRRAFLTIIFLAATGAVLQAQDLEPRAYVNTPVGLNFLLAGYGYTTGGVATDSSLPLENTHVETQGMILGYVRSLNVWGDSGKIQLVVPASWADGTANLVGLAHERQVFGLGDPKLKFSLNFYGSPALSLQEFKDYKQDVLIGGSLQVSFPIGQYDDTKLLNLGTNRWSFKPELGVSKAFGPLTVELIGAVTCYTENGDFLGGHTLAQDSILSVQTHISYSFGHGIWAAFDATYYRGGNTIVDGVVGNAFQENTRIGLTLALPVNKYNSVKLYASTGASTRLAGSDYDAIGILWQYRWGGGL
jgi:hypothetical protein